jgi:hypothetical protein
VSTNPITISDLLAGVNSGNAQTSTSEILSEVLQNVGGRDSGAAVNQLGTELQQLNQTSTGQTQAVAENTQAVLQNTVVQASSGKGSTTSNILKTVFGSGLGLSPVISGIIGLFGGGGEPTPPPLATYTKPAPISLQGGVWSGTGASAIDYRPGGQPRAVSSNNNNPSQASAPQITVQVQAIDSRSFLDHQNEIARAVREAMLNSHSLNDVVSEL